MLGPRLTPGFAEFLGRSQCDRLEPACDWFMDLEGEPAVCCRECGKRLERPAAHVLHRAYCFLEDPDPSPEDATQMIMLLSEEEYGRLQRALEAMGEVGLA